MRADTSLEVHFTRVLPKFFSQERRLGFFWGWVLQNHFRALNSSLFVLRSVGIGPKFHNLLSLCSKELYTIIGADAPFIVEIYGLAHRGG